MYRKYNHIGRNEPMKHELFEDFSCARRGIRRPLMRPSCMVHLVGVAYAECFLDLEHCIEKYTLTAMNHYDPLFTNIHQYYPLVI